MDSSAPGNCGRSWWCRPISTTRCCRVAISSSRTRARSSRPSSRVRRRGTPTHRTGGTPVRGSRRVSTRSRSVAPRTAPRSGRWVPPRTGSGVCSTRTNREATAVGLAHPDHDCCHRAALAVRARRPQCAWFAYADLPYAHIPGVLTARLRALHDRGITASPACLPSAPGDDRKWAAFEHYTTQIAPLEADWDLRRRRARMVETYWRLE
jgi:hypothetical protein